MADTAVELIAAPAPVAGAGVVHARAAVIAIVAIIVIGAVPEVMMAEVAVMPMMAAVVAMTAVGMTVVASTAPDLLDERVRFDGGLRALGARQGRRGGELGSERRAREDRGANGESFEAHLFLLVEIPAAASYVTRCGEIWRVGKIHGVSVF